MREIKFRAWDKVCKKMISVSDLRFKPSGYDMSGLGYISGEYINGGTSGPIDDFELMQYTGLKDKNGKEIYEGDIVKIKFDDSSYILDEYKNREMTHIITMSLGDDYMHNIANTEEKYLEIIGNIYENPDLLPKDD